MPLYLHNLDGTKIPLAVDAEGRLVLAPSGSVALAGPVDSYLYLYNGSTWERARMDGATHTIQVIDYAHHEIHSGSHFFVANFAAIGNGTNVDFLWVVPNTGKWPHAVWSIESDVELEFYLYEAVTTSADGSAVPVYNNNRNSATANGVLAYSGPTLAGGALGDAGQGGTLVYAAKVGSGKKIGGESGRGHEFIGKQNTKYWFRISNNSGGAGWVGYDFNWYEHTNK